MNEARRLKQLEDENRRLKTAAADLTLDSRLEEARRVSEDWRMDYNERRPHQSLQDKNPVEFGAENSSYQTTELSL